MIRLLRVLVPVGSVTLLIADIFLIATAFLTAAYFALQAAPAAYLLYDGGLFNLGVVLASIVFGLYIQDLYSEIYINSKVVLFEQLCVAFGAAFLLQGGITYVDRNLRMPLRWMVLGSMLAALGIFVWRVNFSSHAVRVMGRDRLLFLGGSPLLEEIAVYVEKHPEQAVHVSGYVDDSASFGAVRAGGKVLGRVEDLYGIVQSVDPTRIVVGMSERRNRVPVAELLELRLAGHIVEEVATAYERICGRVSTREVRPSQFIYSGELGPKRSMLLAQSIGNLVLAALGIVVVLPLMILTALAVRLSSPGPILYRQTRVGLGGMPFTMYKFRSMRADAEVGTGAVWAAKDDPRVTGVGRVIRKIRFDELPQLFNVLKGDMALVGPRPERPEFVKDLCERIPYYRQRHCVRPGITGWAQINYKYGDTQEDAITKLEYDLYYIKNLSFSLDSYIVFHTLKTMLISRGAQ